MKRFVATVLLLLVFISGCGNDKYAKEIDEAVRIQNQEQEQLAKKGNDDRANHFKRRDTSIYVYDKDKVIILAYKPLSSDNEAHYYAYDFSDKRISYKQSFDSRRYYQQHDADYHEENMMD